MAGGGRRTLRVRACSWNVANVPPPAATLESWLNDVSTSDVYAIALQEVVDINSPLTYLDVATPLSSLFGGISVDGLVGPISSAAASWQARLVEAFPGCTLLARQTLVGMALFVFVRDEHVRFCGTPRVMALGVGPLGAGNKGAAAASLYVYGSTLCIVCSHLSSGSTAKHCDLRNSESVLLHHTIQFPELGAGGQTPPSTISAHDFVLWMGDFNYRIALPDGEVRALCDKGADGLTSLEKADELRSQQKAGKAFVEYAEGKLTFPPTYKFDKGTDIYDTSKKKRAPAWCDRILWREGEHVRSLDYAYHPELKDSDHRPISASLELRVISSYAAAATAASVQTASQGGELCKGAGDWLKGTWGRCAGMERSPML